MNLLIKWLIYAILISCIFSQELNINTLTDIILQHNLILKLRKKNIEAKSAQLSQSRKFTNPNLSVESEFGGEPDIELGAGIKKNDLGSTFQLEISLPIPIFNQNNGNIQRQVYEFEMSQFELITIEKEIYSQIENLFNSLNELKAEIVLLETMIFPEANSAYSIIMDGYMNGRYTYLEVVNAKEMWFQSQFQYLNALQEYQNKILEINCILGKTNHLLLGEN